ncbi:DUF397 domain-containing protein [Kitasatospora kifunensis]|uniref:DUF397 domain-containing protein n=1 Tax=Kitasatospora kifunensis TaxID=58351 RepID=A0A7W7QXD4_KITKI|nr:DUF397 domain-containing protein [Kitasatospora kifunensis]MBB4921565.1 hypothetical protein [Kitasatospora kifunensis]
MIHLFGTSAHGLSFRKSSYSNGQENCVECAGTLLGSETVVRDSKDPHGPALIFEADAWRSFITGLRAGGFPAGS